MLLLFFFFFFNDTATTEIYTLSLHDALPISHGSGWRRADQHPAQGCDDRHVRLSGWNTKKRSEEHTSELQSRLHLVCRLLLEKKKKGSELHLPVSDEAVIGGYRLLVMQRQRD